MSNTAAHPATACGGRRFLYPLARLIPLLQKLRYGPLELDFGRRVAELVVKAEAELPLDVQTGDGLEAARLLELAPVSPRAAVLEGWLQVE
jgi:hypothetical protein